MKYELKDMEIFLRVVEHGSITKAARTLFTSQPALSRRLTELESALGVKLLERSTRSLQMTEAGQAFYRHARRILRSCESLDQELELLRSGTDQLLRLGYGSNGQFDYAMRIAARLQRLYPAMQTQTQAGDMLETLYEGHVDAALLMACEAAGNSWLSSLPLERAGLSAFVPQGSPLAAESHVTMEQLRGQRFVLPIRRNVSSRLHCTTLFDHIRSYLISQGVDDAQIRVAEGPQAFSVVVAKGQAVGLMPDSSKVIANPLIACRPISDCREGFEVVLAWRAQEDDRPVIRAVREVAASL